MVIAKASRTGNFKCLNSNGISVEIITEIRGNSRYLPFKYSYETVDSIMLFIKLFTENLIPLQSRGRLMWNNYEDADFQY